MEIKVLFILQAYHELNYQMGVRIPPTGTMVIILLQIWRQRSRPAIACESKMQVGKTKIIFLTGPSTGWRGGKEGIHG